MSSAPAKPTRRTNAERAPVETPSFVIRDIPISQIATDEQIIRVDPNDDSIPELAASIQRHGLLQPIGVRALGTTRFQLLWGLRRVLAHLTLKRDTITARVYADTTESVRTLALIENAQRQAMSLEEECLVVTHLHVTENLSPAQIATSLGKSRAWVLRRLALPALPPDLREPVFDGRLSVGAAEKIALLEDPNSRAYIAQQAIATRCPVAVVDEMVRQVQATPSQEDAINAGVEAARVQVAPQPVLMVCAACNTPRRPEELISVRVCAAGCAQPTEEAPHNGTHPGTDRPEDSTD